MVNPKKIEKLLFILASPYAGRTKPVSFKDGVSYNPYNLMDEEAKAYFRIGLDLLRRALLFDNIIVQELSLLSYFSNLEGAML